MAHMMRKTRPLVRALAAVWGSHGSYITGLQGPQQLPRSLCGIFEVSDTVTLFVGT